MPTRNRFSASSAPQTRTPRVGRPPNTETGEVEARILDAATALFMEQGYEGVSFEQISSMAHAGKATIYARYVNKEALFRAVIRRSIDKRLALAETAVGTIESGDRLTQTTLFLLDRMLTAEAVSLTRVVIGEAPRFPSLARLVDEFGRQRAVEIIYRVLAAEHQSGVISDANVDRLPDKETASRFLEQLYPPLILRALIGENIDTIRSEIPRRVLNTVIRFRSMRT
ncbi:TetR/AcrR family transcriptional regulator [Acidisoma cladoniae]|jgi:AcrR family transcriptional regulator|uniref:TetR/AcrR family transcriptional regulator n=1 Tax=Acidisoma cladoniae TaxID=3040935 RepID=UPI00254F5235|nr:TetR/AcrR family transcriptional regulator [Acidisoma sp. PAMC 29798]